MAEDDDTDGQKIARIDATLLSSSIALQEFVNRPVDYIESFGITLSQEQKDKLAESDLKQRATNELLSLLRVEGVNAFL